MAVTLNCAVCPAIFTEIVEPASVIPPTEAPPVPMNTMIGALLVAVVSVVIAIQNEPDRSFEIELVRTTIGLVLVYASSLFWQRPVLFLVSTTGLTYSAIKSE